MQALIALAQHRHVTYSTNKPDYYSNVHYAAHTLITSLFCSMEKNYGWKKARLIKQWKEYMHYNQSHYLSSSGCYLLQVIWWRNSEDWEEKF